MKAAVVESFDSPPHYGEFSDPIPAPGETLVTVSAAALSPLVKGQASGAHYSSAAKFPFIPGVDGVGKLSDGRRVYFAFPRFPYGAMAERVAVPESLCVPLPDDLDDVTAAAIANPGMSSWPALAARAKLVPGETVLINGATGNAGRLAIQIAKHLGAKKVIVTGRNRGSLTELPALGADVMIALDQPEEALTQRFREEMGAGVNVILDYLWGKSAEQLIAAVSGHGSPEGEPRIRYIQVGSVSGSTISLPASALRSSGLELFGSGIGSISNRDLIHAIDALLHAVVPAQLKIETEAVPLTDVESAWTRETDRRLVFTLP
jgi:NADPH:quinone reductase-like Zn-dependent oxidoreductase